MSHVASKQHIIKISSISAYIKHFIQNQILNVYVVDGGHSLESCRKLATHFSFPTVVS